MSEQGGKQTLVLQRPANDDKEAWKAYWLQQGQVWRTEPEIDEERQNCLIERRNIKPDIEQGIYPFKEIKLGRADIEWLLATHENGRGPIDWSDKSQRGREGIDLRGTDLRQINLRGLPLARLCGGLTWYIQSPETQAQRDIAGVHLEGNDLREAHLEGANLHGAHLEGATLELIYLEKADLSRSHLEDTRLKEAHLEDANLVRAYLQRADLKRIHLEGTDLRVAHLEGADLDWAHLEGADLRRAFFDASTNLDSIFIGNAKDLSAHVAGTHWGDVDLTKVFWEQIKITGDEYKARQREKSDGQVKNKSERLIEYRRATRANRQLAVVLRDQGLNEEADHFAYRAQLMQRVVSRQQRKLLKYIFSWFLYLLAGYGYRPVRSVCWYLVIVFGFAIAYLIFAHLPLLPDSLVFSLTSFHGRGFFPGLGSEISLHNPLVILAALEAVLGLFIEISFIATFTQRFFGR